MAGEASAAEVGPPDGPSCCSRAEGVGAKFDTEPAAEPKEEDEEEGQFWLEFCEWEVSRWNRRLEASAVNNQKLSSQTKTTFHWYFRRSILLYSTRSSLFLIFSANISHSRNTYFEQIQKPAANLSRKALKLFITHG